MCLNSMRHNANREHTIAVWDNGSCPELRDWLQHEFKPDILVLSENIGKNSARTSLFRMLPPGAIVGYADDDIYFYPDWLTPQVELLQHFPSVACVTGYPVRTSFRWGNKNTLEWANNKAQVEYGRFIPDTWEYDFCVSIGRDYASHREATRHEADWKVTYKGKEAFCTSHHCQFIGYVDTLNKVPTYDNQAMGEERQFDIDLDRVGLRLATTQRLTRHIGNVLHDELRKEIKAAEVTA